MDAYELSSNCMLNEQISRQLFEFLSDKNVLMAIVDANGSYWPSDSAKFSEYNFNEELLADICSRIDDGAEPIITQMQDCSVVAAQLATERTNCGYVIIVLPQYTPESALANIDLVEIILDQIGLIAKLIEKYNHLYELQLKHFSRHSQSQTNSN